MNQVLTGARIFDGDRLLDDHALLIKDGLVEGVVACSDLPAGQDVRQLDAGILAPGFIDLQVNGGGGAFFTSEPTVESLEAMVEGHRRYGTTCLVPTVISDSREQHQKAVDVIHEALAVHMPGIAGLHIEGPFFAAERRGAHAADKIRTPGEDDLAWLIECAPDLCLLTLAPEKMRAGDIRRLSAAGIKVFAGHSDATSEQIMAALGEGLHGFTHLFNAMRPLNSREPGVVGAALADDSSWIGIIADGHHVHPTSLLLACKARDDGKLLLVSDAMATVGAAEDSFELYGEHIRESGGTLINSEGALAGSAIGLIDAIQVMTERVGLPLEESLRMASLYPARCLGIDTSRGRLAPGLQADLVHFDSNYRVHATWIAGEYRDHGL